MEDLDNDGIFGTLSAKFAVGLTSAISGDLSNQVTLKKEHFKIAKKRLNGRQIAFMILQYFKISALEGQILDLYLEMQ